MVHLEVGSGVAVCTVCSVLLTIKPGHPRQGDAQLDGIQGFTCVPEFLDIDYDLEVEVRCVSVTGIAKHAMPYSIIPYHTIQYHAIPCSTIPYHTIA